MFLPFKKLIDYLMEGKIAKDRSDMYQMIILFSAALLFSHLAACAWCALGTLEEGWLSVKQDFMHDGYDPQFASY